MQWPISLWLWLSILLNPTKIQKSLANNNQDVNNDGKNPDNIAMASSLENDNNGRRFTFGKSNMLRDIYADVKDLKRTFPHVSTDITEMKNDFPEMMKEVTGMNTEVTGMKQEVSGLKSDVTELKNDINNIKKTFLGVKADLYTLRKDMVMVKKHTYGIWVNMSQVSRDIDIVDRLLQSAISNITSNMTDLYEDLRDNYDDYQTLSTNLSESLGDVSQRFDFVNTIWPTLAGHMNNSVIKIDHLGEIQEHLKSVVQQQGHAMLAEFGRLGQKIDTTVFTLNTESMRKHHEVIDTVNNVGTQVMELRRMVQGLSTAAPGQLATLGDIYSRQKLPSFSQFLFSNPPSVTYPTIKTQSTNQLTGALTAALEHVHLLLPYVLPDISHISVGNFTQFFGMDDVQPIVGYGGIAGGGSISGFPGFLDKHTGLFGGIGGVMIFPNPDNKTSPKVLPTVTALAVPSTTTLPPPSPINDISWSDISNFFTNHLPMTLGSQWPNSLPGFPLASSNSLVPLSPPPSIRPANILPAHEIPGLPIPGFPGPTFAPGQPIPGLPTPPTPPPVYQGAPGQNGNPGPPAYNAVPPQATPPSPPAMPPEQQYPPYFPGEFQIGQQAPTTPPAPQYPPHFPGQSQNGQPAPPMPPAQQYPPYSPGQSQNGQPAPPTPPAPQYPPYFPGESQNGQPPPPTPPAPQYPPYFPGQSQNGHQYPPTWPTQAPTPTPLPLYPNESSYNGQYPQPPPSYHEVTQPPTEILVFRPTESYRPSYTQPRPPVRPPTTPAPLPPPTLPSTTPAPPPPMYFPHDTSLTAAMLIQPTALPLGVGPLSGKCVCVCSCHCGCPILPPSWDSITTSTTPGPTTKNMFGWWQPNYNARQANEAPMCSCLCPCDCPEQAPTMTSTSMPSHWPDYGNHTTPQPHYDEPGITEQWPPEPIQHDRPDMPNNYGLNNEAVIDALYHELHEIKEDIRSLKHSVQDEMAVTRAAITGQMNNKIDEMKYFLSDTHHTNVAFHNDNLNRTESLGAQMSEHSEEMLYMMTAVSNLLVKMNDVIEKLASSNGDSDAYSYDTYSSSNSDYGQYGHHYTEFWHKTPATTVKSTRIGDSGSTEPTPRNKSSKKKKKNKKNQKSRRYLPMMSPRVAVTTPTVKKNKTEERSTNDTSSKLTISNRKRSNNSKSKIKKDDDSLEMIDIGEPDNDSSEENLIAMTSRPSSHLAARDIERMLQSRINSRLNRKFNPKWQTRSGRRYPVNASPYRNHIPINVRPISPSITDLNAYLTRIGINPIVPKHLLHQVRPPIIMKPLDPYHIIRQLPNVPKEILSAARSDKPFHASYTDGEGNNVNINVNRRHSLANEDKENNPDEIKPRKDISKPSDVITFKNTDSMDIEH